MRLFGGKRRLVERVRDEVLQEIRDNPDADVSARVRAAMTLLDRGGVPAGSEVTVAARAPVDRAEVLAQVEARVAARQDARNGEPAAK